MLHACRNFCYNATTWDYSRVTFLFIFCHCVISFVFIVFLAVVFLYSKPLSYLTFSVFGSYWRRDGLLFPGGVHARGGVQVDAEIGAACMCVFAC